MFLRKKLFLILILLAGKTLAQTQDSLHLKEVIVKAYLTDRPILRLPASVAVINREEIQHQPGQSLVPVMNIVPGVRMEERSPGSYRLSIRGSLLRSPFGVRNVKTYIDEFPLTDAGGNTYLNLVDLNSVYNVEVLKGPDGSLFGANSGGVIRLGVLNDHADSSTGYLSAGGGSFGLRYQKAGWQQKAGKNILSVNESWLKSDGYRKQSALDRKYFQLADQWNYSQKSHIKALLMYADLDYQTPGGLTLLQFNADAKQARPGTKFVPGAEIQKARIRNRTLYGGVLHEILIKENLRHVIALFGSHSVIENPFITNYEERNENSAGLRTWIEARTRKEKLIRWTWNLGTEMQRTQSGISNYGNIKGTKDTLQAADKLIATQAIIFTKLTVDLGNRLTAEGAISLNLNNYQFGKLHPENSPLTKNTFDPQLMPRLAISYSPGELVSYRVSASKGYSPPTLAEIRSSDNVINTGLQPENGWNYETGVRLHNKSGRLWWDASVFYYRLDNAIVRRINVAGAEYFINAGGTNQPGLESLVIFNLVQPQKTGIIRALQLRNAVTYSDFKFRNYKDNTSDYSGNALTGVPKNVTVTSARISFPYSLSLFVQHNYTSKIGLNDANSFYAEAYHLLQLKAGWEFKFNRHLQCQLTAGADNLLDQKYSLGNDLNAFGGRYYNAAPGRNYFAELKLLF